MYDQLTSENGPNLRWLCDVCDESVMSAKSTNGNRINELVELIERLTAKVENLEAKLGDVTVVESSQKRLEDKVEQMSISIGDKLDKLEEQRDSERD